MLGNEDDASIHSRSPDCPKLGLPSQAQTVAPPVGFDLPDINPLDHQIALAPHLTAVAIDVSQELSLQYFEPEVNLAGRPRIWGAAQKLRDALRQAQEREAVAEHEWKKQWNMPRMGMPSSGWV
ncbi:hypothetical protein ASPSYDRAFT_165473 [Aspergillus sydowii CBS 593.65]|uniref:Uncharacterized protein n=1 Tax=Aspergillus sydowii CBS 593.65 TaxID=1036612 RepID=A0A1L9SXG8_9EURO|nr:uncharacterized protein ASPSYDRAFT_165473 [Aspergillus sydowii CBS 593.65]OJJ51884.1 hypothetical protein ASPSYDRAFT_165473 [Aspergillus sydowii CBS 593.65]